MVPVGAKKMAPTSNAPPPVRNINQKYAYLPWGWVLLGENTHFLRRRCRHRRRKYYENNRLGVLGRNVTTVTSPTQDTQPPLLEICAQPMLGTDFQKQEPICDYWLLLVGVREHDMSCFQFFTRTIRVRERKQRKSYDEFFSNERFRITKKDIKIKIIQL